MINVQMVASLAELGVMRHSDAIAPSSIACKPVTTFTYAFSRTLAHTLISMLLALSLVITATKQLFRVCSAHRKRVCTWMHVCLDVLVGTSDSFALIEI